MHQPEAQHYYIFCCDIMKIFNIVMFLKNNDFYFFQKHPPTLFICHLIPKAFGYEYMDSLQKQTKALKFTYKNKLTYQ